MAQDALRRVVHNSPDHDDVNSVDAQTGQEASQPLLADELDVVQQSHSSREVDELRANHTHLLSRATSRISSTGIALGYSAGILLLLLTLVPVTKLKGSTFALRLAITMSGAWWALFTIPAWAWLPGGEAGATRKQWDGDWTLGNEVLKAWMKLGSMLRWTEIKKMKNTFWFLGAWFLLSDGACHILIALRPLVIIHW